MPPPRARVCSGVAHVEIDRDPVVRGRDAREVRQRSAGTDPAHSRHGHVTTRAVAFVLGASLPHRGRPRSALVARLVPLRHPGRAPSRPPTRCRAPLALGAAPRRRARAGRSSRRAPTPRRRPSRARRRGVASRARHREYNRCDERPRHLPSARRGQRADQELRARLAGASRAARPARARWPPSASTSRW